ncbi:hypothetical protein PVIIG_05807 [Plasmodium vivax India VII]|uniref:Variable surface protein n=1 Tax=Plasmodium vivax India VII TaxID=1077284 RepID=A0A0J9S2D0_PLAVI|nr:hypothetical protein PVIIG_05807 [Plasmodium vivax India VII]
MELFGNYNVRDSIKFVVLLKFFTYIYLIWNPINDMVNHNAVEMKFKLNRNLNINFKRLLAKHELKKNLYKTHERPNYIDYRMNKDIKNEAEKKSTYSQVMGDKLNELDAYKKDYNRRYGRKKGLSRLECYFEKNVFDNIDYIDGLVEKMQNNKKLLKKTLWYNFGIRFILFSLIPVIWLIVPLVPYGYFAANYNCYDDCKKDSHKNAGASAVYTHNDTKYHRAPIKETTWDAITIVNTVLYCVTAFIVLSIIIYIFIKFIKYQRLKACRSKMSIKEYCKFCKSLFI